MDPRHLDKHFYETERMARLALAYMPRQSKYRSWAYQLFSEEIAAWKYMKLRARLIKFHSQA